MVGLQNCIACFLFQMGVMQSKMQKAKFALRNHATAHLHLPALWVHHQVPGGVICLMRPLFFFHKQKDWLRPSLLASFKVDLDPLAAHVPSRKASETV